MFLQSSVVQLVFGHLHWMVDGHNAVVCRVRACRQVGTQDQVVDHVHVGRGRDITTVVEPYLEQVKKKQFYYGLGK